MFSESLSSDDGNDQYEDKYKDKDTETQKQTKTKCFQDPMYAIFLKNSAWIQGYQIWHFFQKFPPKLSIEICPLKLEYLSFAQLVYLDLLNKKIGAAYFAHNCTE